MYLEVVMPKLFATALALVALGALGCKDEPVDDPSAPLVDLERMPDYDLELPPPETRARAAEVFVPQDEIVVHGEEMTMPPLEIYVPLDER
jgi:hypothetical protein